MKVLKAVLVGFLGLYCMYLAAGNLFINTRLLDWVLAGWTDGRLNYQWAYTVIPGRVHVMNAILRQQDPFVQWTAYLENTTLNIRLPGLFKRRFEVNGASARGAKFHLRAKGIPDEAIKVEQKIIPPFEDFDWKSPAKPDPNSLWQVKMENVAIEKLNEIWISEYRFRGQGKVHGGFFLDKGLATEVGPTLLDLHQGEISFGDQIASEVFEMRIQAQIASFAPNIPPRALLPKLDAELQLSSARVDLGFLNYYFAKIPWLRIERGYGPLNMVLHLKNGQLQKGSTLDASSKHLEIELRKSLLKGEAGIALRVEDDARLNLEMKKLSFSVGKISPEATINDINLHLRGRPFLLSLPLDLEEAKLRFNGGVLTVTPELAEALTKKGVPLSEGKALFSADWTAFPNEFADYGRIAVEIEDTKTNSDRFRAKISGKMEAKFSKSSLMKGWLRADEVGVFLNVRRRKRDYSVKAVMKNANLRLEPFQSYGSGDFVATALEGPVQDLVLGDSVGDRLLSLIPLDTMSSQFRYRVTSKTGIGHVLFKKAPLDVSQWVTVNHLGIIRFGLAQENETSVFQPFADEKWMGKMVTAE